MLNQVEFEWQSVLFIQNALLFLHHVNHGSFVADNNVFRNYSVMQLNVHSCGS